MRAPKGRQQQQQQQQHSHRDSHICQYCGHGDDTLSIDHVVPRSRGGTDSWENVATACLPCNVRKANRTPREAGMPLLREPRRPLGSLGFEASRQIRTGQHQEWAKYVVESQMIQTPAA